MAKWVDIPKDVAFKIIETLEFHEDFMAFKGVCTSWRSAAKEAKFRACVATKSLPWSSSMALPHDHHEFPWLIIVPDNQRNNDKYDDCYYFDSNDNHDYSLPYNNNRLIYNVCHGTITHLDLPPIPCYHFNGDTHNLMQEKGLILSSRGWLLSLAKENHDDLKPGLLNPFTGAQIQLPRLEIWSKNRHQVLPFLHNTALFQKFILSTTPSSANDNDYSVAIILQEPYLNLSLQWEIVASWKKGDDHWVQLKMLMNDKDCPYLDLCSDIAFYKGEFYAIDDNGDLLAFKPGQALPRLVAGFADRGLFSPSDRDSRTLFYLVESMDRLLLLCREKRLTDEKCPYYKTISFEVFEVNVENGDAKKVHNLGDRAVFVGTNSSFSVKASPSHGCKPNCIYYTDDFRSLYYSCRRKYDSRGKDSGIYNFTTKEFESCTYHCSSLGASVSGSTRPMWLESPASTITNFDH